MRKACRPGVRGGGLRYQNRGPPFANRSPRLSLFSEIISERSSPSRVRFAAPSSGPFRTTTSGEEGKAHSERLPRQGTTSPPFWYPFSPPPTVRGSFGKVQMGPKKYRL